MKRRYLLLSVSLLFSWGIAQANPCAPQNPCAAKNPCASQGIEPKLVTRPADTQLTQMSEGAALKLGKILWMDTELSSNGLACQSCHANNAAFKPSFAEDYPHAVQMAVDQAGVKLVHLDEMIQFCMLAPMATQPFPWDSEELAALTAYTAAQQKVFQAQAKPANPCAK